MRNPFTKTKQIEPYYPTHEPTHIETALLDTISKLTRLTEREMQLEEQIKRDQDELEQIRQTIVAYNTAKTHLEGAQTVNNMPWDAILNGADQRIEGND